MFEVAVEHTFAAAHNLREYRGKCERLHGHNYRIQVALEGQELNSIGLLYDFVDVKGLLREISARFDHQYMNEVPPFDRINPSAENMAKHFFDEIQSGIAGAAPANSIRVSWVKVWETDTSVATYRAR